MNAVDMAQFIAPKSDQLNADDLIGGPRTITVTAVSANEGSPEQPININFEGDDRKPYKPCKSMRRVMVAVWGADASKYVGRAMTLYRDAKVQFGGMQVGGIRISHMSHIDEPKTMALTATRAKRAPFTVQPLKIAPPASDADAHAVWTEKFIANIARAPSAEKLEAFVASKEGKLAELSVDRPELRQECQKAIASKRADFIAADDDDDPFAEPASDASEPEESESDRRLKVFRERIQAADSAATLKAIDKDWQNAMAAYDDATAAEIDAELAARRKALAGEGGQ